jgi:ABC-type dipeptide/oligopeptide/nickel transport system ATPase component
MTCHNESQDYLLNTFDLKPTHDNTYKIPKIMSEFIERVSNDQWKTVLVIGSSGSGKSMFLKHIGKLFSIPIFNDETLVTNCLEDTISIDEFTSNLDRTSAKIFAKRFLNKLHTRVILASPHRDTVSFYKYDIIVDLDNDSFYETLSHIVKSPGQKISKKIPTKKIIKLITSNFNIGLVIGNSNIYHNECINIIKNYDYITLVRDWKKRDCVINQIDNDISKASNKLMLSGLTSIPTWLQTPDTLSTGQEFRALIAKNIKSNMLILHFGNHLDLLTSWGTARSIHKLIRETGCTRVIISTYLTGIEKWLHPDWIIDYNTSFSGKYTERKRHTVAVYEKLPKRCQMGKLDDIVLLIHARKVTDKSVWDRYKNHHYLSSKISTSATFYEFYFGDVPVAFIAYNHSVFAKRYFPKADNVYKEHRVVTLYRGLGIGPAISTWMGAKLKSQNIVYMGFTRHPVFGGWKDKDVKNWKPNTTNHKKRLKNQMTISTSNKNMEKIYIYSYSHTYIGKKIKKTTQSKYTSKQLCSGEAFLNALSGY